MSFTLHCVVKQNLPYCVVKIPFQNKYLFSSFFEKIRKNILVFKGNFHYTVEKMVLHNKLQSEAHVQN